MGVIGGAIRFVPHAAPLMRRPRTLRPAAARNACSCAAPSSSSGGSGADLFVGMDFGTSGARAVAITDVGDIAAEATQSYADSGGGWGATWESALFGNLEALGAEALRFVRSVAIDGTSATAMLLDRGSGELLAPPKMYNEAQSDAALAAVEEIAPEGHTVRAATSTLAKLVAWQQDGAIAAAQVGRAVTRCMRMPCLLKAQGKGADVALAHQADWLAALLHGRWDASDWNNALKLGFDPGTEHFPPWMTSQDFAALLPRRVLAPGAGVGLVSTQAAQRGGLPQDCLVCTGTTDSIAAFLAVGIEPTDLGAAVTSLGSTLAVKLLSDTRVDDCAYGLYSHRLGDAWLVGGASNTGGAVLRQFFDDAQLAALTEQIDIERSPGLDYYPLVRPGERFPVNDPQLAPRLEPRPDSDAAFLHGMLEGITNIEAEAYRLLRQMGASPLTQVYTAGGGSKNEKWTAMRAAKLGVPVRPSPRAEAAYGAALLARRGWKDWCKT